MFVYFDTLKSDHEVADTKLVELVANSNIAPNKTVMVRSPSGLHRHHLAQNFSFQVLIDNGTGRSRKICNNNSNKLPAISCKTVPGLHSLTGNDYV